MTQQQQYALYRYTDEEMATLPASQHPRFRDLTDEQKKWAIIDAREYFNTRSSFPLLTIRNVMERLNLRIFRSFCKHYKRYRYLVWEDDLCFLKSFQ